MILQIVRTSYLTIGIVVSAVLIFNTSFSQFLSKEQESFLKRNSKTIYQNNIQEQGNWTSVLSKIEGKRLILIGEFNHGSKEIFELRNSLIKCLHTTTGANVVLFESGIGELILADLNRDTLSSSQMVNGLFGGWRTREFIELFDYVKSQQISIAGFDVQRTGGSFTNVLDNIAQRVDFSPTNIHDLESMFGSISRDLTRKGAVYDSLKNGTNKLIHDYQMVKEKIAIYVMGEGSKDLLFTVRTINNRICYLNYMLQFLKDKNWSKRFSARDSVMASNVQWLVDTIYRDQQIIIVGHNFHIGKYNENETVMGEILKTLYGHEMYSIGIFAASGAYSNNFGKEVEMTLPDSTQLDIKHVIGKLPGSINFIDIPETFSKDSHWLNQEIIVNDTFIDLRNSNQINLSKTFDGLILLRMVSPTK